MRRHRRPLLALVVAVGLIGGPVGPITAQNRPKVAYIYVGPVGDAGWTFQHDQARKYLEQTLGADTKFVESVPETAEVTRVLEQFISERSEEHTSELQSRLHLVCRLLLEKKNNKRHCLI